MDPRIIAALALGWAGISQGQPGQWMVIAKPAPPPVENQVYITIQGGPSFRGKIRLIRGGKTLGIFDLKKMRAHPESDIKLEPSDVLQIPESMF